MSKPRRIRKGNVWFVTRRTTRRHFLLRPDADGTIQQLYWYTTAVIANELGIEFHAAQMLSTHMHEVVTDVFGNLPRFLHRRNRILANAIKCHRRWPEEVFSRAPTNCVELYGPDAVAKEIAYTLANCVEAGLVHHPDEWPGVSVSVEDIGTKVIRVRRPDAYFNPDNPRWPEVAELRIVMPRVLVDRFETVDGARGALRRVVQAAVAAARASAVAAGRVAKRVASLFRVSPMSRAGSYEPFGKRLPTFATAGDPARTATAKREQREFLTAYRSALDRFKNGFRDVVFPYGSWRFPQELGTLVAAPPAEFNVAEFNVGRFSSVGSQLGGSQLGGSQLGGSQSWAKRPLWKADSRS